MKVTDYLAEWLTLQETTLQRSTHETLRVYLTATLSPTLTPSAPSWRS